MKDPDAAVPANSVAGEFSIALRRKAAPGDIGPLDIDWTMSLVKAARQLRLPCTVTPDHLGFRSEADRDTVLALANRHHEQARASARELARCGKP